MEAETKQKASTEQVYSSDLPPDVEVSKQSLIAWMQKVDEGMKITHTHLADNNRILERLLIEHINMQEQINQLQNKQ